MAVIRPCHAEDEAAILRLFSLVFQSDMSPLVWRWKYLRDGLAPPAFVAEEEGEIVCHYGTIRQRVSWQGTEHYAWDAIDVMAHPRRQGRGLFRQTVQAFMRETCAGQGLFLYGFPTERHKRLGELLVGYEPVSRVHKVSKTLPSMISRETAPGVVYDVLPLHWDRHWQRLEQSVALTTRRDYDYLTWRYLERPNGHYRLVTIPTAPALAVLGLQPGKALLMEFLVAPDDDSLARQLLAATERVAREAGAEVLEGWMPQLSWGRHFLCSSAGYRGEDADHWLECRIFDHRLTAAWLAAHFYYSLGDFDVY